MNPVINISVYPNDSLCLGDTAIFYVTSTLHLASNRFNWRKNSGGSYNTYDDSLIINYYGHSDTIFCKASSNVTCAVKGQHTSNKIVLDVDSTRYDPKANITVSPGTVVPKEIDVTFTAQLSDTGGNPSIQWLRNGTIIPGAVATTFKATSGFLSSGDQISLRIENMTSRCFTTSSVDTSNILTITINNSISSINDPSALSLYPNPNSGTFTLRGDAGNGINTITIQNVVGQMIHTEQIDVHDNKLNKQISLPATTPPGIYIFKVSSGYNTHTQRFIIED